MSPFFVELTIYLFMDSGDLHQNATLCVFSANAQSIFERVQNVGLSLIKATGNWNLQVGISVIYHYAMPRFAQISCMLIM